MFTPESSASPISWLLAPFALVLLWGAGHLALRALPSPCRPVTDFLAALLALFFSAFACDAFGIGISLYSLGLGVSLFAAAGLVLAITQHAPLRLTLLPPLTSSLPKLREISHELWWALPCALAFGSVFARGVIDPLAGWDNLWRWNHLALVVHETGSLSAYPPVTADEFLIYPWCDGIPPLAPLLNLWIYVVAGSTHGGLIAWRLALELLLVGTLTWRIAHELWGGVGARIALLALASSALFLASVSIAQETGLTTLALLAAVHAALAYQKDGRFSSAAWLAVSASVAALCRDYNLLFLPAVLAFLLLRRMALREIALVALLLFLLVAPWYARNWIKTGNPLFAHTLGNLFPVPAYHAYLMAEIRCFWSPSVAPEFYSSLAGAMLAGCGGLALVTVAALRSIVKNAAMPVLGATAILSVTLWALSISSTAGGVVYSLRVLGPALPLLAVATGAWAFAAKQIRLLMMLMLGLLVVDAARRHWLFFLDPLSPPLPYTWSGWRRTDQIHAHFSRERLWAALSKSATGEATVADNPGYTVLGAHMGVAITPLSSPRLRALNGPHTASTNTHELIAALRADGVRFIVLANDTSFARASHARHPALGKILALPPAGTHQGLLIYDLRLLEESGRTLPPPQPDQGLGSTPASNIARP